MKKKAKRLTKKELKKFQDEVKKSIESAKEIKETEKPKYEYYDWDITGRNRWENYDEDRPY